METDLAIPRKLTVRVFLSFALGGTARIALRKINYALRLAALQRPANTVSSSIVTRYFNFLNCSSHWNILDMFNERKH